MATDLIARGLAIKIGKQIDDISLTGGAGVASEEFTATAGQTIFTLTNTNGVICDVHIDNVFQNPSSYTLNEAKNAATLSSGADAGQKVVLGYSTAVAGEGSVTVADTNTLGLTLTGTELKGTVLAVKDQNTSTGVAQAKIWTGTEAEYTAIAVKDAGTLYFCK